MYSRARYWRHLPKYLCRRASVTYMAEFSFESAIDGRSTNATYAKGWDTRSMLSQIPPFAFVNLSRNTALRVKRAQENVKTPITARTA